MLRPLFWEYVTSFIEKCTGIDIKKYRKALKKEEQTEQLIIGHEFKL